MVQCEISRRVLYLHLTSNLGTNDSWRGGADEIFARHQNLWAENGDGLSRIYAGTGALKSSVTRTGKVTLASVLGDATKSVNRFYINNFQDKAKQEVIDLLLGKLVHQKGIVIHDPVNDSVNEALVTRTKEYSTTSKITVFAGTYNLNGKSSKGESLAPWLLNLSAGMAEPEIYAIGFQEIVELSPQQVGYCLCMHSAISREHPSSFEVSLRRRGSLQIMITDVEKRCICLLCSSSLAHYTSLYSFLPKLTSVCLHRLAWEFEIEKTLNSRCSSGSRYVLLRSDQLVGAALIVYAKESVVAHVRNVECSIKKVCLRTRMH
ncbi:hypothetical protein BC936DRAFT_142935 [Jimgerdemannia flammicorona]|uniref:Inositol polyphosphate-related phosphatase domain-containing protein n=1 Tax=Jimgerdemannia flammicorona TaxID=994334 RepID=A0A432ZZL6_9FUNG|nr:hypothetical protein BC936DRAFT_142935 [Jimgerdemannia flammicorona]